MKQMDESEKCTHLPISWEEKGMEQGIKKVAIKMLKIFTE